MKRDGVDFIRPLDPIADALWDAAIAKAEAHVRAIKEAHFKAVSAELDRESQEQALADAIEPLPEEPEA